MSILPLITFRSILPQLHKPMSQEYYILFYSTVFTNLIVNPRSHESESNRSKSKPPKHNEWKPLRELNSKLVQHFPLYAALYPLSYRQVVAILHKTAFINPRRYLWQNTPKSYFAVNSKIDTTEIITDTCHAL